MTMVPCFLDEIIEKSMKYSIKSFGGHKPLVHIQGYSIMSTFKSCPEKFPYNPD